MNGKGTRRKDSPSWFDVKHVNILMISVGFPICFSAQKQVSKWIKGKKGMAMMCHQQKGIRRLSVSEDPQSSASALGAWQTLWIALSRIQYHPVMSVLSRSQATASALNEPSCRTRQFITKDHRTHTATKSILQLGGDGGFAQNEIHQNIDNAKPSRPYRQSWAPRASMILFIFEYLCRVSYVAHAIKGLENGELNVLVSWRPNEQLNRRVKIHENNPSKSGIERRGCFTTDSMLARCVLARKQTQMHKQTYFLKPIWWYTDLGLNNPKFLIVLFKQTYMHWRLT